MQTRIGSGVSLLRARPTTAICYGSACCHRSRCHLSATNDRWASWRTVSAVHTLQAFEALGAAPRRSACRRQTVLKFLTSSALRRRRTCCTRAQGADHAYVPNEPASAHRIIDPNPMFVERALVLSREAGGLAAANPHHWAGARCAWGMAVDLSAEAAKLAAAAGRRRLRHPTKVGLTSHRRHHRQAYKRDMRSRSPPHLGIQLAECGSGPANPRLLMHPLSHAGAAFFTPTASRAAR